MDSSLLSKRCHGLALNPPTPKASKRQAAHTHTIVGTPSRFDYRTFATIAHRKFGQGNKRFERRSFAACAG